MSNALLEEIWKTRDQIGAEGGYDLKRLGTIVRREELKSGVAQLKQHNVKFRIEPMATPVCSMTMIYDPDGNTICIHKRKTK